VADGAGGAIIAWEDSRNGPQDIVVQRVNASALPLWAETGALLCTAPEIQANPAIAPDGRGR
jgi:hypothetical protein